MSCGIDHEATFYSDTFFIFPSLLYFHAANMILGVVRIVSHLSSIGIVHAVLRE